LVEEGKEEGMTDLERVEMAVRRTRSRLRFGENTHPMLVLDILADELLRVHLERNDGVNDGEGE
jgi:hypothetical protein